MHGESFEELVLFVFLIITNQKRFYCDAAGKLDQVYQDLKYVSLQAIYFLLILGIILVANSGHGLDPVSFKVLIPHRVQIRNINADDLSQDFNQVLVVHCIEVAEPGRNLKVLGHVASL